MIRVAIYMTVILAQCGQLQAESKEIQEIPGSRSLDNLRKIIGNDAKDIRMSGVKAVNITDGNGEIPAFLITFEVDGRVIELVERRTPVPPLKDK